MGLLSLTPIVILILQLCGANGNLPTLPGNVLLTGEARKLPNSVLIDCVQGGMVVSDFQRKKTAKPTDTLKSSNFEAYPFTSNAVVPGILTHGGIGRFSFVKLTNGLTGTRTAYALQVDGSDESERAYWLPQSGVIDIVRRPGATDPKWVFTADYSGCSWTVTPTNNNTMLRVRHVEGGREVDQFNNLNLQQKGGSTTYAMQFKDYGYIHKHGRLIEHVTGYAYMRYSDGRWSIHVQHQTCAPRPGNFVYKNGHIETMKMSYFNQKNYTAITGTESWAISN